MLGPCRRLLSEHRALLVEADALRDRQESTSASAVGGAASRDAPVVASPSIFSSRYWFGDFSLHDASCLWREFKAGVPREAAIAAVSVALACLFQICKMRASAALLGATSALAGGSENAAALPSIMAAVRDMTLFGLAEWGALVLKDILLGRARVKRVEASRVILFASLMRQDLAFHGRAEHSSAKLAPLIAEYSAKFDELCVNGLERLVQGLVALCTFFWLARSDPVLLSIALLLRLPQILQATEMTVRIAVAYERLEADRLSSAQAAASESLAHVRTIQAFGAESGEVRAYFRKIGEYSRVARANALAATLLRNSEKVLLLFTEAVVYAYGAYRIAMGHATLAGTSGNSMLIGTVIENFHGLEHVYHMIRGAHLLGRRFFLLRDRPPEVPLPLPLPTELMSAALTSTAPEAAPKNLDASKFAGSLRFEDVTFLKLDSVSFSVPAGKMTALVGDSGCGKSTALSLMVRFADPERGRIFLDDIDIKSLPVPQLRQLVCLLDQNAGTLLGRSIRNNIALGLDEPVDEDELTRAAASAAALGFINAELSDKLNHLVGSGTNRPLSGGEGQRVALARVFMRHAQAKVFILDEADSSLDPHSKRHVYASLKLLEGITKVVVTHNLPPTLSEIEQTFDNIIVFEQGRVVQEGTPLELAKVKGAFQRIVSQLGHANT